jgi:hypothetical protein
MSERPTDANGCGSWPTPNFQDAENAGGPNAKHVTLTRATTAGTAVSAGKSPPTPADSGDAASVAGEPASAMWPTPVDTTKGGGKVRGGDRGDELLLPGAVLAWASPASRDWRDGKASAETMERNSRPLNEQVVSGSWMTPNVVDVTGRKYQRSGGKEYLCLPGQVDPESDSTDGKPSASLRLNPAWVAQLMGFPDGWLELGESN